MLGGQKGRHLMSGLRGKYINKKLHKLKTGYEPSNFYSVYVDINKHHSAEALKIMNTLTQLQIDLLGGVFNDC